MTRHSDAFLPSGGFDRDMLLATSPPPTATQFDLSTTYALQPVYKHDTRSSSHATTVAPAFTPSAPHFAHASPDRPLASSHPFIRRDSSLSPTDIGIARAPRPPTRPPAGSLQRDAPSPSLAVATSLSRSASADAAAPQQTSLHLVQRLAQQNSLIRAAWEAERKYLEANRKRAEEVYQEERAIMEDVRQSWTSQKAAMQRDMQALRERVQHLEAENAGLKSLTSPASQVSGLVSPAASSKLHADLLPPGLEGASRRPHFVNSSSSRNSPTANSELAMATPLDPRTQPETSSARDFLAPPNKDSKIPLPLIDVQEIDPELDGIFIKANAVRGTFAQSSVKSSPATSPPPTDHNSAEHEGLSNRRSSSKAQTMQALAAGEVRRRTMHAGHTPNHSLSLFPTMTTLDGSITAGQSEATTPTATNKAADLDNDDAEPETVPEKDLAPNEPAESAQPDTAISLQAPENAQIEDIGGLEPRFEPKDDVPLKGPLMVKNIPAQDEIFWAQVNQRLEGIRHSDEDALPTVIKSQMDTPEAEESSGSHDGPEASKSVEVDVPLRIKSTTNFGAPFGVA